MVGRACQWSGVPMTTASMSLRSSTRRKSRVTSSGFCFTVSASSTSFCATATWASSTSQRATHWTPGTFTKSRRSPRPIPPQPMSAIRMRSFAPATWSAEDARAVAPPSTALVAPNPIESLKNRRRLPDLIDVLLRWGQVWNCEFTIPDLTPSLLRRPRPGASRRPWSKPSGSAPPPRWLRPSGPAR